MVQVHSGPLSGVIAQLVERQLCKLDVRSSSLLSSRKAPPGAGNTIRAMASILKTLATTYEKATSTE